MLITFEAQLYVETKVQTCVTDILVEQVEEMIGAFDKIISIETIEDNGLRSMGASLNPMPLFMVTIERSI